MSKRSDLVRLVFIFIVVVNAVQSKKQHDERYCEVCIKTIQSFIDKFPENEKTNQQKIEKAFKHYCNNQVRVDSKEDRLCYYIGASKISATQALAEFSKPLSWGIPVEKICRERLAQTNPQICELKYERPIDLDAVDLNKLKVKDLKKVLTDWGEPSDFVEKSDYIRRINEVKEKYVSASKEL